MKYEDLEKLNNLREKGAITEEEYNREKEKILNREEPAFNRKPLAMDTNTYNMFIHLSQFCGLIIPLAGMIVPIILWISGKDNHWSIDKHGRIVMNWIISSLIYAAVSAVLIILLIGIPLLIALAICSIIFIIIGAIKAKDGIFWKYPMSIEFFNTNIEPAE